MIWERSASSGACSENARRSGIPQPVIRSIPGSQPTVDTVVRRWVMPTSGSLAAAASTLSAFISGSPIPMNTRWFTGSMRRKCRTWSRISETVRLRPNRMAPVAQNVHVSGQPDCDDTHTERRPSR